MPLTDNNGVALRYETDGPADADAVVFVEGLGYGRWMWRWQRERVAESYYAIFPDNRGTGGSDAPPGPYTIAEMASDLEAVLADAGVDRAHVVGASMGGMVAQQYAIEYDRAASLVLMCTSHGGPDSVPTPPETVDRMFSVPDEYDEREAIRYKMEPAMSEAFTEDNDETVEQIVDWRLESDAPEDAREAQAAAVASFDSSNRLDAVEQPTLLVHGTDDRVLPWENARLLESKLPNARLVRVDGGSHLFFLERPTETNDRLLSFFDDVR